MIIFHTAHVFSTFRQIIDDFNAMYPYAMVQPKLRNRKEYKVVVLAKKAAYISSIASGSVIHINQNDSGMF